MIVYVFFFTLLNLFSVEYRPNICYECIAPVNSKESYYQHILERHHQTQKECFFCDEKPVLTSLSRPSNYHLFGNHCARKHTDFVVGLYLHYYNEEPQMNRIAEWNSEYLSKKNDLFVKRVTCGACNKEVRAVAALYHFIKEFWANYKRCQKCNISFVPNRNRKYITVDFLDVISHRKKCDFQSLNNHFMQIFPTLMLNMHESVLSMNIHHQVITLETLDLLPENPSIQLYQELNICNRKFGENSCNAVLTNEELIPHVAKDVCMDQYSAYCMRTCCYCKQYCVATDYYVHLIHFHSQDLSQEALKLTLPSTDMMINNMCE